MKSVTGAVTKQDLVFIGGGWFYFPEVEEGNLVFRGKVVLNKWVVKQPQEMVIRPACESQNKFFGGNY